MIGYETYITSNTTFSRSSEIIYLNNFNVNNDVRITLTNAVKQLTTIGNSTNVYKFYIDVVNRVDNLIINFQNTNFIAPVGKDAIKADAGNYLLTINFAGVNSITGRAGEVDTNGVGKNGNNGILAYRLNILGGSVKITGGKGGAGDSGISGLSGMDGLNGPSGWFLNSIKGDDGLPGQDGTHGKDGGKGGHAIPTLSIRDSLYILKGKAGGKGGDGGEGGIGGSGGNPGAYGERGLDGDSGIDGENGIIEVIYQAELNCAT